MSDSVRPHRRQPTRLPRPWDSPGKNTRVGCHFLLQCMKAKSESEVAQSCPTLSDPMDCGSRGSSVHGIFQVRVLALGAIAFSELSHQGSLLDHSKCFSYRSQSVLSCSLLLFTLMHWRRKWHPTLVFLPGESQGRGSLVGCRLWGRTESDTTEAT